MNYKGYKWLDEAKTRRSAEVLEMSTGENIAQFTKRCKLNGFEVVDPRNVIDRYKTMSDILIKGDLNSKRFNFSILLQNLAGDFNKATSIRCNNAFCGKEVILFGDKGYDRRGTCGMHLYEQMSHVKELSKLEGLFEQYDHIIGIDNVDGAEPINSYQFDHNANTLFVFGEEGIGICPEILELCDKVLYIKQFGAVRSINVGCASAIVMYEYTRGL